MNIDCKKCGHTIDVSESIKGKLLSDEVLKQTKEIKSKFQAQLKDKEDELSNEVILLVQENNKIKERELVFRQQKMVLEDELKSANIKAEEKMRLEFLLKEERLEKSNKAILAKEKSKLVDELNQNQEILNQQKDLEIATKSLEVERLKKEAEDARKKLDHTSSSQELIGEAAELHLLDMLKQAFPTHAFEEIKKGAKGADIFQTVVSKSGNNIGTIYYESKKTKAWQQTWIAKFKDDIREKNADVGILVTTVFPKDFEGEFAFIEDIWVCSRRFATQLARVIANQLLEISKVKGASEGKASLEGLVYNYITSNEFISKIKVVAEAHQNLQVNLDKEKIAMEKIWSARRKEIERSFVNVAQIFGDLEGVSQGALGSIDELNLITHND
ncbi:DUF2130 domain-containing protein [Gammaproteobacteria bacterium]|nr:DUF2130 domain-containing protein [Gammaproteobacteria bacterium]